MCFLFNKDFEGFKDFETGTNSMEISLEMLKKIRCTFRMSKMSECQKGERVKVSKETVVLIGLEIMLRKY